MTVNMFQLLRVSDLVLNCGCNKPFGLIRDLFVGRNIIEDENGPDSDAFVKVLRRNLIGEDTARSYLSPAEKQIENPAFLELLNVGRG